ncbi:hypothetical protein H4R34_003293 [Dimargaris verticillata]|uniref:Uncharacterized protein n=1 Tax=Dimargaris verticillata TaxID=2761393 RepID=A0A9W8EDA5_9FUNG|nr:hypothetical protein H4R34_003293 [Dimargaris verticillata]
MATSIYAKFAVEGVTKGLKSLETPSPSNEKINTVPLARLWYPVIDDLLSTLVINDQVDAAKLLAEWIQAQLKSGLSPMSPTYLLKEVPLPPGVALPLNVHRTLDDLFKPAPLPPGIVLPPQQPESPPTLPQSPDPQPPWQLLPAAEVPSSRPAGGFSTGSGTTQSSSESSPRSPTSARYYGHDPWSEHHRLLELLFKRAVWAYKLGRQEMQKALLDQITCENLRNQVFRDECIALKNTGALPSVYQVSLETSQDAIAGSSSNSNDGSATQSASTTATDQDMVPQNPDMYDFPSNYQILFSGTRVTQISKPDAPVNLQKDEPPVSEDENNYTN